MVACRPHSADTARWQTAVRSRGCARRRSRQSDSGDSRITIAAPTFWEVFPKALALDQESCAVGMLPRQFADLHELQGGERTTFAFVLAVGDDPVSAEPLAWARSPLIVSADPDAYRRAGLWAPLAVGSPEATQKLRGAGWWRHCGRVAVQRSTRDDRRIRLAPFRRDLRRP